MKRGILILLAVMGFGALSAKTGVGVSAGRSGQNSLWDRKGGGPGDEEKKEDKEEKLKTKKYKLTAAKQARLSARDAKAASTLKAKEITARASVRNFYHKTFNTKPGKAVNYRKQHKRNMRPYRKGLF